MTDETAKKVKNKDYLFKKGKPGGPGRPQGSRNKTSILLDQIGHENAVPLINKMLMFALEDDDPSVSQPAVKYILDKLWIPVKGSRINLGEVKARNGEDVAKIAETVFKMMFTGDLTIEEGAMLGTVIDQKHKLVLDTDITKKIEEKCSGN